MTSPQSPPILWLVEDNPAYRRSVARVLNSTGQLLCPRQFASCESLLDALREASPPNVILLDLGLPGMSGLDALPLIKEVAPGVPVIVLTVFDDREKIFQAICAGASGYLLKTSTGRKIAEAIQEVLDGGAPMTASIAYKVLQRFAELTTPKGDYGLSAREREILEHMVDGLIKKEIAGRLSLSPHTVDTHLRNIYSKLHVHTRTGAVSKALRERLC